MKSVAFLTLALLAVTLGYSQLEYDNFDPKKMSLNGVKYGDGQATVIKTFGQPLQKTNATEEIKKMPYTVFHYQTFRLEFWDKAALLQGFEVADTSVILTYGTTRIKVGDPVTVLAKLFPNSYRTFQKRNGKDALLRTFIKDNGVFFVIDKGRIISFHTWAA